MEIRETASIGMNPYTEAEKERIRELTMDINAAWGELREIAGRRFVVCILHRKGSAFGPQPTLCPICAIAECRKRMPQKAGLQMWPNGKAQIVR